MFLEMSRWGDAKTLKFVIHYRNHECLWNPNDVLYRNRLARNTAYQNLVEVMEDPLLNVKAVKIKIKNLRSVYHSELRKLKSHDGSQGHKPGVCWFNEMHSFLGDVKESLESSIEMDLKSSHLEDISDQHISPHSEDDNINHTNISLEEGSKLPKSYLSKLEQRSQETSILQRPFRKRQCDISVAEALEQIESMSNNRQDNDEFYYFGLNVAAQLRMLPLCSALDMQIEIQKLLSVARRQQIYPNLSNCSELLEDKSQDDTFKEEEVLTSQENNVTAASDQKID